MARRVENRLCPSLRVLIYHRLGEPLTDPWAQSVRADHFNQQLTVLVEAGHLVPLDLELRNRHRWLSSKPRFAITFDDGYVDNLDVLIPILERHDAPATVFIATRYVEQPYFWWDRLAEIVEITPDSSLEQAAVTVGLVGPESLATNCDGASSLLRKLYDRLVNSGWDERIGYLEAITELCDFRPRGDAPRPLTNAELVSLADHPLITIGAHTDMHSRLTTLSPEEAFRDISDGDRKLDALLGPATRLFAYPNGNTNAAVGRLVKRAGHDIALTTISRPISRFDDRLFLPRIATDDVDGAEFARRRRLGPAGACSV